MGLRAYIWDKLNLKSQEVDLRKFDRLDGAASKVHAGGSVAELVKMLLMEMRSDLEKVRAIWIWVCHHIEYDVEGFHNTELRSSSPDSALRSEKAVCAGYAGLFKEMCSLAGVQCVEISGYSKGYGHEIGTQFRGDSDHAWNAVHLEGKWHLLDSTWGAGNVNHNSTEFTFRYAGTYSLSFLQIFLEFIHATLQACLCHQTSYSILLLHSSYNEFYFLTNPALFIEDHFPMESKWQLLEPKISLQQFENNLQKSSHFYNLGLQSIQPESSVVRTVNGKANITIEGTSPTLFIQKLHENKDCAIISLKTNGAEIEVYPQKTGKQKLKLFAKAFSSKDESYHFICEYLVHCDSINRKFKIPKELNNPVGPSWLTESQGLLQPSQPNPIIHTEDGRCSIKFKVEKDLIFIAGLHTDDFQMTEVVEKSHFIQSESDNWVEFNVQLPQAGSFVFKIYAKEKSTHSETYDFICNYLIFCAKSKVKWSPFPKEMSNPVGPNWVLEKEGFSQPSQLNPIIYTDDGRCTFKFHTEKELRVMAMLYSDDVQMTEDIKRRHIFQSQREQWVEFKVQLPQAGMFVFQLYANKKSVPGNHYNFICNYLISCTNPKVKWSIFPLTYNK
ncbi:kyphoscoliosis peptidase [Latimeria chalumnae]|uniref:kyphoscoliosis peptidase n=1 Tax=Latimeria chalumnae TaxID=7897 RepID=UPI0006D926AF|nr:PREDICTED: kyphoscoliosis peptidase [Latimeria chalumnae]|eukprot:XP_014349634.1 PREDICTED: kyphoscoliosis peptidase [Latimeria chalumnae]